MRLALVFSIALLESTAGALAQQGYGPGFAAPSAPYVHPSFQSSGTYPYGGSSASSSTSQQSGYPGGQGGTYPYSNSGSATDQSKDNAARRPFGTLGSGHGKY